MRRNRQRLGHILQRVFELVGIHFNEGPEAQECCPVSPALVQCTDLGLGNIQLPVGEICLTQVSIQSLDIHM